MKAGSSAVASAVDGEGDEGDEGGLREDVEDLVGCEDCVLEWRIAGLVQFYGDFSRRNIGQVFVQLPVCQEFE